jgi:trehalose 6-phosphate synthase
MNLVVKEYIASQDPDDPGVPILSRFAGAAEQLVDAIVVNPYDVEEMADAVKTALEMEKSERIARHARLMAVIRSYDVAAWSNSFITTLEGIVRERLAPSPSIHEALTRLEEAVRRSPPRPAEIVSAVPDAKPGRRRSGKTI